MIISSNSIEQFHLPKTDLIIILKYNSTFGLKKISVDRNWQPYFSLVYLECIKCAWNFSSSYLFLLYVLLLRSPRSAMHSMIFSLSKPMIRVIFGLSNSKNPIIYIYIHIFSHFFFFLVFLLWTGYFFFIPRLVACFTLMMYFGSFSCYVFLWVLSC